jgi:D-serine deaminase-like pyridoxal phosphate-dependent protein
MTPTAQADRATVHPVIRDTSAIFSPALLFYKDLIIQNIKRAISIAGAPDRLRPHVKTHKTREIVRLELSEGISKHKCATIAEAEMLAGCGAPDIFLAYPLVGPNCGRMARLMAKFPKSRFAVAADHPEAVRALSEVMTAAEQTVDVVLDIDVGQRRTGVSPGSEADSLYELICRLPGLRPGGIQAYDGHNHQESPLEREAQVHGLMKLVLPIRQRLESRGWPVPRLIAGGTPTFPVYAGMEIPGLECSPGTCILHDHGYGSKFPDVAGFTPAALLLTRVVSRPTRTRVTLDLGTKAVASDPPAGKRCQLLGIGKYEAVLHNEEHLVIETPEAERFKPGDELYAMPSHICPTCALHREAHVIEDGCVTDRWQIVARDRMLTV